VLSKYDFKLTEEASAKLLETSENKQVGWNITFFLALI